MEERRVGERITFTTRALSNEDVPRAERYEQIIKIMKKSGVPMTAKEIAIEMFKRGYTNSDERNNAAPRLTELSQRGKVEPVGKKQCDYTGKMVSCYVLRGN